MEENNNNEIKPTTESSTENSGSTSVPSSSTSSDTEIKGSPNMHMIIGVVVAVALLLGGYFLFQSDGPKTTEVTENYVFEPIDFSTEVVRVNGEVLYGSSLMLQMAQAVQMAILRMTRRPSRWI